MNAALSRKNVTRFLFTGMLILSALAAPFFATLLLMAIGFFYYPRYWEPVAVALLIELLYRGDGRGLLDTPAFFALLIFMVFVAVELMRAVVRTRTE